MGLIISRNRMKRAVAAAMVFFSMRVAELQARADTPHRPKATAVFVAESGELKEAGLAYKKYLAEMYQKNTWTKEEGQKLAELGIKYGTLLAAAGEAALKEENIPQAKALLVKFESVFETVHLLHHSKDLLNAYLGFITAAKKVARKMAWENAQIPPGIYAGKSEHFQWMLHSHPHGFAELSTRGIPFDDLEFAEATKGVPQKVKEFLKKTLEERKQVFR